MFSLLWSEHCSYKHSRKLLRTLPTEGEHVVMGPGENAGAVDVGDGLAVAFKVESHNHPSAVEPFQGAATGVGGILRDIFAIGARPIAVLDSLRFGEPSSARSRYLLERAVAGIGHYGNSVGVATVGGEIYYEALRAELPRQRDGSRPGAARPHDPQRRGGRGQRRGALRILDGPRRHRRRLRAGQRELGIDEDKRPTVQVGDPFAGKKALECSLELLERGLLVSAGPRRRRTDVVLRRDGVQGRGGAGPRRRPRPAARGGHRAVRDHGQRSAGADALRVRARPGRQGPRRLREMGGPRHRDRRRHRHRAPAGAGRRPRRRGRSGDGARRRLPPLRPRAGAAGGAPVPAPAATLDPAADARATLLALLASPNVASRLPLFQQYDWIVQSRTVRRPGDADAAVLRLPGGNAIAVAIEAPAGGSPPTPTPARSRRCSSARRTSRAPAQSRSG